MIARLFYSLALHLLLPYVGLRLWWRGRRQPGYRRHLGERFGLYPVPRRGPTIWIHAVSVGETRAAQPLVARLRTLYPDHRILLTHMTPTGRDTSEVLFGDSVDRAYLPYDFPWAMARFVAHFRPALGVLMETEIWPNLIAACRRQGVPLLLLNARLSEKSAKGYRRLALLSRPALAGFAAVAAQGADDAQRLRALGAARVEVMGNTKFDIEPPAEQLRLGAELRRRFGGRPVLLAASTRDGEEELILDALARFHEPRFEKGGQGGFSGARKRSGVGEIPLGPPFAKGEAGGALLLLVPRHPQRFEAVARLAEERGFKLQRRSADEAIAPQTQVVLGDSMGEMFAYYAAADVAFVGGSLLPYGSQNLIEACAVGTPVLIGPSTYNFAEAAQKAIEAGAARHVADADDLLVQAHALLADDAARAAMGAAGNAFTEEHRGATERAVALCREVLSPHPDPLPACGERG